MAKNTIKAAAKTADSTWNRLLELAEKKGVSVYMARFEYPLNGFYFNRGEIRCIGIRNSLTDYRKNFVLAHELGHAVYIVGAVTWCLPNRMMIGNGLKRLKWRLIDLPKDSSGCWRATCEIITKIEGGK